MKKIIMLLGFWNSTNQVCIAQYDSCKPSCSINIGIAKPIGNYGLIDDVTGDNFVGQALPGIALNISSNIPISHSHWGICGSLGYYENGFNSYHYLYYSNGSNAHATPYKDFSLMVGLFVNMGSKKIFFNVHLLVGADLLVTPQLSYNLPYWVLYQISSTNLISVAVDFGTGVMWKITTKIQGALNVDYYYSRLSYTPTYTQTPQFQYTPPNYGYTPPTTLIVPISLLNIMVGVAYEL